MLSRAQYFAMAAAACSFGASAALAQRIGGAEAPIERSTPDERLHQDARDMATVLDLDPAQERLLQAFLETGKPPERRPPPQVPMNTPQVLDQMADQQARRQADFDRRRQATLALYDALRPGQRTAFDALMRLRRPPPPPFRPGGPGPPPAGEPPL